MGSSDFDEEYKLFGKDKHEVFDLCFGKKFPGTLKYEPNHPVWECNIYNKKSPIEAWKDHDLLIKAIDNLFWICEKSIKENKYPEFLARIENAFKEEGILLQREVLLRFTVAKIAPKVTALQPFMFEKILKESNVDISSGIYCPMAGFGGIVEGAKRYFKKNKINAEIEAYDINKRFCDYFGWIQRDVLAQKIVTDKVVFVCPPFGEKTEQWPDTPMVRDDIFKTNYLSFEKWCLLIKEYIKASDYIFVGPEIGLKRQNENNNVKASLFGKKYGIQLYKF